MVRCHFSVLQMRSCAFYPRCGLGAFGILPVLLKKRYIIFLRHLHLIFSYFVFHFYHIHSTDEAYNSCRVSAEDYGVMGLRYASGKLSAGVTVMPFASMYSGFIVITSLLLNFGLY